MRAIVAAHELPHTRRSLFAAHWRAENQAGRITTARLPAGSRTGQEYRHECFINYVLHVIPPHYAQFIL